MLCVDGHPSGGRFKSATDFLSVALVPPAAEPNRRLVRPEIVSEEPPYWTAT